MLYTHIWCLITIIQLWCELYAFAYLLRHHWAPLRKAAEKLEVENRKLDAEEKKEEAEGGDEEEGQEFEVDNGVDPDAFLIQDFVAFYIYYGVYNTWVAVKRVWRMWIRGLLWLWMRGTGVRELESDVGGGGGEGETASGAGLEKLLKEEKYYVQRVGRMRLAVRKRGGGGRGRAPGGGRK